MKYRLLSRVLATKKLSRQAVLLCCVFFVTLFTLSKIDWHRQYVSFVNFYYGDIVDFTYADNVTGFDRNIVPNLVHFVRLGKKPIGFIEAVCIRAAYLHQNPDVLYIHCDKCQYSCTGPYWDIVSGIPVIKPTFIKKPEHVFGKILSSVYHQSDIARLRILRQYGGIFLDNDAYIVRNLDAFRKFEMTLGWPPKQNLGTQILVAHKNARFLRLWYESYRWYRPTRWYYNAGELPTQSILVPRPYLVHRVPYDFNVHNVAFLLFGVCSREWIHMYGVHLLERHREYLVNDKKAPKVLDEDNIRMYDTTFGEMARLVLFGTVKRIAQNASVESIEEVKKLTVDRPLVSECGNSVKDRWKEGKT